MRICGLITITILCCGLAAAQQGNTCSGLPPGRHALLERFTAQLGLTCEQQLKIEPVLHSEESVTKPLLRYTALTQEEKTAMMTTIKVAARKQVRDLLTPDQQKKMDEDISYVSKHGKEPGMNSRPKQKSQKKEGPPDIFADEESLSNAIQNYPALSSEERRSMLLEVKEAALRDSNQLNSDQREQLEAAIRELKK
jgi:hypothetical protein